MEHFWASGLMQHKGRQQKHLVWNHNMYQAVVQTEKGSPIPKRSNKVAG